MSLTGMDIVEVRNLAAQLDNSASNIQDIVSRLTQNLNGTNWIGPDRERFVGEWQGAHCQQLNAVVQSLQDAANKARMNADEQEAVASR